MHAVGHRLAELTVIRDIDVELALMPNDIGNRRAQRLLGDGGYWAADRARTQV